MRQIHFSAGTPHLGLYVAPPDPVVGWGGGHSQTSTPHPEPPPATPCHFNYSTTFIRRVIAVPPLATTVHYCAAGVDTTTVQEIQITEDSARKTLLI